MSFFRYTDIIVKSFYVSVPYLSYYKPILMLPIKQNFV